ncbi:MAG: ATP-binding cassette domain-containing protein [Spirochaetales bacterium]|nr:ATP-binding cassette domain-containing protein [Spirochaetales bacterium]
MDTMLQVRNLKKYFPIKGSLFGSSPSYVHALEDVDMDLYRGETLGVVGESGSGKSTLGRTIIRLEQPTAGKVLFEGRDVSSLRGEALKKFRTDIQMVFQDPYASLNPRLSVGSAISEPMIAHKRFSSKAEVKEATEELMRKVGLQPSMRSQYPHNFSGGQRQRIGIARALSLNPKVLICDEAVSALDVSVQSQILNLFNALKRDLGLTYLFIAHDLSVVRYISDRILVLYLGTVMEIAPKTGLFDRHYHPYTESLISASPEPSTAKRKGRIILSGEIPSPINPPSGCKFHTRCFKCMERCKIEEPALKEIEAGHFVRCHLYGDKGRD